MSSLSVDGHLGCFKIYLLQIILPWTLGCIYLFILVFSFFFFSNIYPAVELLNHMAVLFLVIWRTSILFSIVVASMCSNNILWFPFLHLLANICYLYILIIASFDEYVVLPHCGFSFLSWFTILSIFCVPCCPFVYLLMNNVGLLFRPSAHFLMGLFLFLGGNCCMSCLYKFIWAVRTVICFRHQPLINHVICRYHLPFSGFLFILPIISFAIQKLLSLIRSICLFLLYLFTLKSQIQKKYCYNLCLHILPAFCCRSFMFLGLTF